MKVLASIAQVVAIAYWLVTAFYALLASQPFAHEHFLQPELVPAVAAFARFHRFMGAAILAIYLAFHLVGLRGRSRSSQMVTLLTGAVWTVAAIVAFFLPPLSSLHPGPVADWLTFAALIPVLLMAAVDLTSAEPIDRALPAPRHASDFVVCLAAAAVTTLMSAAIAIAKDLEPVTEMLPGILTTGLLQMLVFAVVFLCLTIGRAIAALCGSRLVEACAAAVLLAGAFFLVFWRIVLPSVVSGASRTVALSFAFAVVLSAALTGRGLRASTTGDDPVARVMSALSPRILTGSPAFVAVWLVLLGLAAFAFKAASATADWNFVVARLDVIAGWMAVFSALARSVRVPSAGNPATFLACAGLSLALYLGWTTTAADRVLAASGIDREAGLRTWTARDPAARMLTDALTPAVSTSDTDLFDFLQAHTNVPVSVRVAPVDLSLSPLTASPAAYRPHVFLFVVDSLRRDYLGPYNRAVTFTPEIDRFAGESAVFTRAFTRYGATGLSVPSIWTGAMLLHKQYVTPFAPMNTLSKLLDGQGYRQWTGMDHIMHAILPASTRLVPLDASRTVKDFRLCGTLEEIRERISSRASTDDPVFAYTLSQDIHVSAIMREGNQAIDNEPYGEFNAPVASRIRRFDRCFGAFIGDLKARGIYEDSVIILTSDHGDSLGEDGRMGHAYTLFPEIVQVPLIVRLPSRLSESRVAENEGPVFTTDITPTLYELLGARPERPQPFMGMPLFRSSGSPPRTLGPLAPVLASSYGAVYAALSNQARTLYILDSVNLREYSYELDGSGAGRSVATTDALRAEGQDAIRSTVELIADFYGFTPPR